MSRFCKSCSACCVGNSSSGREELCFEVAKFVCSSERVKMVGDARYCCKHSFAETGDEASSVGTWELVVSVVCRRLRLSWWDFLVFLILELNSCLRLFMAWRTLLAEEVLMFDLWARLDMLEECNKD